ncbi:hypothetical protein [Eudoraea sp.]|uniref:hypothetical protein n=1 Tax=Eudoraea sp. TaxID=1979955 RepID=UPI003C75C701
MIVVHIITKQEKQARMIIDLLLHKKLLLDAMIAKKEIYTLHKLTKKVTANPNFLIVGQTKALLFNEISEVLKTNFAKKMPVFYAMPIIYMDDNQTKNIKKNIQFV